MVGAIGFTHHKICCIIGVHAEERLQEQEIYVDLKVECDFSCCAKSDDIQDTVSYVALADICTRLACSRQYQLIETFAYDVLQKLLADFAIEGAWIKVMKPNALPTALYAVVELSCRRAK